MVTFEHNLTMDLVCQNYMYVKKHSYFQLLAVKAAIVEDVKTLSQYISPVVQQFIVKQAAINEQYAVSGWESDDND